jgi:hypothetical protein
LETELITPPAQLNIPDLDKNNIYAQDPVFNDLDKQLLQSLGIKVVEHPAAFDLVNDRTFLFCPGAERSHLKQLLRPRSASASASGSGSGSAPAVVFGGPLESDLVFSLSLDKDSRENDDDDDDDDNDDDESDVLATFVRTRRSLLLPQFEPNVHAFWNMRLYWKESES